MNPKKLLKAMNHIDNELIEEAKPKHTECSRKEEKTNETISDNLLSAKQSRWRIWIPTAGCIGVALAGIACIIWLNSQERIYFLPKEEGHFVKDMTDTNETKIQAETGITEIALEQNDTIYAEEEKDSSFDTETATFPGIMLDPSISEASGFLYYHYNYDDGTYATFNEDYELAKNLTLTDVITRYLEMNKLSDTYIETASIVVSPAKTESTDGMVSHTTAFNTYEIYLTGGTPDEPYLIGLINTIISYSENSVGPDFVKLYINNQPVVLSNEMPEQGYSYINVKLN